MIFFSSATIFQILNTGNIGFEGILTVVMYLWFLNELVNKIFLKILDRKENDVVEVGNGNTDSLCSLCIALEAL